MAAAWRPSCACYFANSCCWFSGKCEAASLLRKYASSATYGGWMHWGSQNDCREIRGGASSDKVIGYLKKAASYVTKDVCEERPKGESRNRKHLMMLDMAARAMCCDKCIEKARSCFGAGTPNFTGKTHGNGEG